jgi:O-antigen/teichoic acid export membrane protein
MIVLQLAVSIAAGIAAILWDQHMRGSGHGDRVGLLLWGALVGIFAAYGVTFLIVWARFGWKAARTVRFLDHRINADRFRR